MLAFDGCDPGANPWVEKYFYDCVMDYRDAVGFTLGLCSIFVWLTAQLPQFISNVKNQSSEALSIWFLVEWFAGDTLNLLGCLIQGQQLPTTTILAAYFVLMDVIMLLQYIYYGAVQARRKRMRAKAHRKRHHGHHHAGTSHQQSRDSTSHASSRPGQDGGTNPVTRSTSYSDGASLVVQTGSPDDAGGVSSRTSWRTVTAATAAGVSIVCVAALALRPGSGPPPGGSPAAAGAWLRGSLASGDHLPRRHMLTDELFQPSLERSGSSAAGAGASIAAAVAAAAAAAAVGLAPPGDLPAPPESPPGRSDPVTCRFLNCDVALVAGTAMGYLSTCFYLASRISQIRKNLARKSTEGLSRYMFLLTMSANLCTGISIVLRLRSLEQVKEQLPWMCGTFGTIALDATLFYQAVTLGQDGHEHHHGHGHGHHSHGHDHSHGHGHMHRHASGHGRRNGLVGAEGGSGGVEGGVKPADLEAPLLAGFPVEEVEEVVGSAEEAEPRG